MNHKNHALFWLLVLVVLAGVVWVLGDVLLPFVCGITIAYLLDPLLKKFTRFNIRRKWAVLIILGTFFLIVGALLAIIIPFVYRQSLQLANDLPQYAERIQVQMVPYLDWVQTRFNTDLTQYQVALKDNLGRVFKVGGTVLGGIIGGGQVVISFLSFLVITPIVAYFMMRQWSMITRWIDDMIPRRNYAVIRNLLTHMDIKVSGFIRGQLIISFFLGLMYAIALSIAGLNFSVLIGLLAGILSVIPLVGSTVGLVVSILVAWFQSQSIEYTGIIMAIFFAGQFLEGNIITPKVMGDSVGLHPLWILFALLAGGALFGITGMFLAVPVAAVIGVLLSFSINQYKNSLYYDNVAADAPPPTAVQVVVQVASDTQGETPTVAVASVKTTDPTPTNT